MKIKPFIVFPIILIFSLASCDQITLDFGSSLSTSSDESIYDESTNFDSILNSSQESSQIINTSSSDDSTLISSEVINSSSVDSSLSSSVDISSLKKLSLNQYSTSSNDLDYSTGSYGSFYDEYEFSFYRAYKSGNELLHLVPYLSITGVDGLSSSFYNQTSIKGIQQISLTYSSGNSKGEKHQIKYSSNRNLEKVYEFDLSTSKKTIDIQIDNANYFSVESSDVQLNIYQIDIYYSGSNQVSNVVNGSGDDQYRLNLESLDYTSLIHGVSKVNFPISFNKIGDNNYEVTDVKEYIYYEYDEIKNNPSLAYEIALTDPCDIANYYIAFGTYPVNYVQKSDYSQAYQIFKEKTRCVSTYQRTDGYATSVPYATGSNYKPLYYELDLDLLGNYSSNNRGAGRLVAWYYGFDQNKGAINYQKNQPVIVYTDDHYATFKEYLGGNRWSVNFDSEMERTNTKWSCSTTLYEL